MVKGKADDKFTTPKKEKKVKKEIQTLSKKHLRFLIKNRIYDGSEGNKNNDLGKCFREMEPIVPEAVDGIIVQQDFECPICLEILVRPTVNECGHSFCLECLETAEEREKNCPVCRKEQAFFKKEVSTEMEHTIEQFVLNSETINKYFERKNKQLLNEQVPTFKYLEPVSYKNAHNVWKEGRVMDTNNIINKEGRCVEVARIEDIYSFEIFTFELPTKEVIKREELKSFLHIENVTYVPTNWERFEFPQMRRRIFSNYEHLINFETVAEEFYPRRMTRILPERSPTAFLYPYEEENIADSMEHLIDNYEIINNPEESLFMSIRANSLENYREYPIGFNLPNYINPFNNEQLIEDLFELNSNL